MTRTSPPRPHLETDLARHRFLADLHVGDPGSRRPGATPRDHLLDGLRESFEDGLDAATWRFRTQPLTSRASASVRQVSRNQTFWTRPMTITRRRSRFTAARLHVTWRASPPAGVRGDPRTPSVCRPTAHRYAPVKCPPRQPASPTQVVGRSVSVDRFLRLSDGASGRYSLTLASAPGLVLDLLPAVLARFCSSTRVRLGPPAHVGDDTELGLGVYFSAGLPMFFSAVKLTSVVNATVISAVQPAID